jgi:hypothetical protein
MSARVDHDHRTDRRSRFRVLHRLGNTDSEDTMILSSEEKSKLLQAIETLSRLDVPRAHRSKVCLGLTMLLSEARVTITPAEFKARVIKRCVEVILPYHDMVLELAADEFRKVIG